jgi:hypothetical protein
MPHPRMRLSATPRLHNPRSTFGYRLHPAHIGDVLLAEDTAARAWGAGGEANRLAIVLPFSIPKRGQLADPDQTDIPSACRWAAFITLCRPPTRSCGARV